MMLAGLPVPADAIHDLATLARIPALTSWPSGSGTASPKM